jgi:hypothetical protein
MSGLNEWIAKSRAISPCNFATSAQSVTMGMLNLEQVR